MKVFIPNRFIDQLAYYEEILKAIESYNSFKDCYIFLHFSIPGSREVDMVVITTNSMQLIEIKKEIFSEINANEQWKVIHKGKVEVYKKNIGKDHQPENPYQQATNTSDKLKIWMIKNKRIFFSPEFLTFIESNDFKIFPNVFIIKSSFLDPNTIQKSKWCYISHGIEELPSILVRNWRSNYIYEEDILALAEELGLNEHSSKIQNQGIKPNQNLIQIMTFMAKNNQPMYDMNQIQEKVFDSTIRSRLLIGAINRGLKDKFIIKTDQGYILTSEVQVFLKEGYTINEIFVLWPSFTRINQIKILDPKFWRVIEGTSLIPAQKPSSFNLLTVTQKIPDDLLTYNFAIMSNVYPFEPLFFRKGSITLAEYEANILPQIFDQEGSNLVLKVKSLVQNGKTVLLYGGPGSGKSTLAKMVGFELIKDKYPVIFLEPGYIDSSTTQTLFKYEEQIGMNNTSKNELLIVIIENIHLASPDEIQQLKLIIKKYESISILITSRKNTLQSASGEDILEPLQNNDIGEQINLEEVIDYKSLIETLVSKLMDHYLNLVSNKPKESVKSIFHDSNETNFLLQLLRIQALLEYSIPDLKTANGLKMSPLTSKEQYKIVEKLELIKSNDYEGIIDNILIEHFQSNIQSLSSSNISRYMLEKILFFCYALSSLEIPIEEELLAKLWSFQQVDLRKIFVLLDKNGIFNTSFETDYTLPHPEYSSRLIEAIENSHSLLSEFTTEFINDFSNDKTLHFIDVLREKIIEIDPIRGSKLVSLKTGSEQNKEIQSEKPTLTLAKLVEKVDEYTLDEFLYLYRKVNHYLNYENISNTRKFFNSIPEEKLIELIHSSESFTAIDAFVRELNFILYPKLTNILNNINIDFLIDLAVNDQNFHQTIIKQWNWYKTEIFEIKMYLKRLFDLNLFIQWESHNITKQILDIIDNLEINDILSHFQDISPRKLQDTYEFLIFSSKQLNTDSKLFRALITHYLSLKTNHSNIQLITTTLIVLDPSNLFHKEIFDNIKHQFNLEDLSHTLKECKIIDLTDFLITFNKFDSTLFTTFDQYFTEDEITHLILEDFNEPESFGDWFKFLIEMQKMYYKRLPAILETLGVDFFKELIENEHDSFPPVPFLKVILEVDWPTKIQVLDSTDFYPILAKRWSFRFIVPILASYIPEKVESIGKRIFQELLIEKQVYSYEIENFLNIAEEMKWSWKQWVNVDILIRFIETHSEGELYSFKELIKEFQKLGWEIPAKIEEALKERDLFYEQMFFARMNAYSKVSYLFRQKNDLDQAVKILKEIAPSVKDRNDFDTYVSTIHHFPEQLKEVLINCLEPKQLIGITASEQIYYIEIIIKNLLEHNYRKLSEYLFLLFTQLPQYASQVVEKKSEFKLTNNYYEEIIKKLIEIREYPLVYQIIRNNSKQLEPFKNLLINQLIEFTPVDPYILLLLRTLGGEIDLSGVFEAFITQMRIDDIISVINSKIDEKTIERVLLILKKLTISEAKTIINTTNNYTLNAFFELLNQNNGNEIVKLWINSLTEKERNESLLKGEELEKNLMLKWIRLFQ